MKLRALTNYGTSVDLSAKLEPLLRVALHIDMDGLAAQNGETVIDGVKLC